MADWTEVLLASKSQSMCSFFPQIAARWCAGEKVRGRLLFGSVSRHGPISAGWMLGSLKWRHVGGYGPTAGAFFLVPVATQTNRKAPAVGPYPRKCASTRPAIRPLQRWAIALKCSRNSTMQAAMYCIVLLVMVWVCWKHLSCCCLLLPPPPLPCVGHPSRHLLDGDVMLTNRQPTLHKPSLMAHKYAQTARAPLPSSKHTHPHTILLCWLSFA